MRDSLSYAVYQQFFLRSGTSGRSQSMRFACSMQANLFLFFGSRITQQAFRHAVADGMLLISVMQALSCQVLQDAQVFLGEGMVLSHFDTRGLILEAGKTLRSLLCRQQADCV